MTAQDTRPRAPEARNLPLELARAVQKAVALAQREKSTWIRADLIMYLGRVLPRTGMAPAAAAALLEDLAGRALRSRFEPVSRIVVPRQRPAPRAMGANPCARSPPRRGDGIVDDNTIDEQAEEIESGWQLGHAGGTRSRTSTSSR